VRTVPPIVVAAGVLVFAAVPAPAGAGDHSRRHAKRCGSKTLYGRTLAVRVHGDPIPCPKVRRIIRGRCRERRTWSCFSFDPPGPVLVWFRERERFWERWSTAIVARRPPCAWAHVSWRSWRRARRSNDEGFSEPQAGHG